MKQAPAGHNLAGIIPISGRDSKLKLPWPDCMQPLQEDLLSIERSVYECATMNCDTIWIICSDSTAPIIKDRLGDYVVNPNIYDDWNFKKHPNSSKKYIPIFYTPVLRRHINRIDSLGWSVLHGALTAFIVSKKISKWVVPTSYYVSFPYGVYDPLSLKKYRSEIKAGQKVYATFKEKSVREGLYLPFSFTPDCWLSIRRQLNESNTGGDRNLPIKERWSAKNFTLDKIFKHDNIVVDKKVNLEFYYDLDSWDNLSTFYQSGEKLKKFPSSMIKPYFLRKEERC